MTSHVIHSATVVLFDDEEFQPLVDAMTHLTKMKSATFLGGLLVMTFYHRLSRPRDTSGTNGMDQTRSRHAMLVPTDHTAPERYLWFNKR
jgi:hypothetical protein